MNSFLADNTLNIEGKLWHEKIDWIGLIIVFGLLTVVLVIYSWIPMLISVPVCFFLLYFQREINDKIKKNV